MNTEETIKQLESAINVVNAAINITNSFLDKNSWKYKRNNLTRAEVELCLKRQIMSLKESK